MKPRHLTLIQITVTYVINSSGLRPMAPYIATQKIVAPIICFYINNMNKIQELQFELMKMASFNNFNGEQVVKDLQAHPELWKGAIMDRPDLIKLRDIGDGYWNVDTVYIIPKDGMEQGLKDLADDWGADEVHYYSKGQANLELGGGTNQVLRVWWD